MTDLFLYDDADARSFEPFALTRPASELRAGTLLIRERWEHALSARAAGSVAAGHLEHFAEFGAPAVLPAQGELQSGCILANARFAPAIGQARAADVWSCDGRVAAVRLRKSLKLERLADGSAALEDFVAPGTEHATLEGWWLERAWDVIRFLDAMLRDDIARPHGYRDGPAGWVATADVLGESRVVVEDGATVEPHVVIDARSGPVLVRRGASVASFSRLVGPCAIGADTHVLGGKVGGSSIGDSCRVHGEMSACVIVGHSNKAHEGFVGHSVLGRWVNLGASTVTSNLKNTYGSVQIRTAGGSVDTGLQFLGTMLGDHAKTAIGTRLTTGCVIGAGANVVLDGLSPKSIAPFAWGGSGNPQEEVYDIERFLEVAARVMQRRSVQLTDAQRAHLRRAWTARGGDGA